MTWLTAIPGALKLVPRPVWYVLLAALAYHFALSWHAGQVKAHDRTILAARDVQWQAVLGKTIANYRAAAEQAREADAANKVRVEAEQQAISERTSNDLQARLADARARADSLRKQLEAASPHSGSTGAAPVSGVPAATGRPAQAASDRLSVDERLLATEQGIQLDELIKWVKAQAGVNVNGK